jgi:nitric oxide reductase NorD protein
MVSEMNAAQRVQSPGRPQEVLHSDDPLASAFVVIEHPPRAGTHRYPEWDFRTDAFNAAGTTLHEGPAAQGALSWVETTLARHRPLVQLVRRQFACLRAEPLRLRRQRDGDDVDLDAQVEARADRRAGGTAGDALYESRRRARRNVAVQLLIDTSGSTDGWIADSRRVIDVEKEALLVVCEALQSLGDPFAVAAFSGEGPHGVEVRTVKGFDEAHGVDVARRIAGLEPDRSTRAGAALRHAAQALRAQPAAHRLLILLSDGKPNDVDRYDGRYGVEDMRHAVAEVRAAGIVPFCLTIERSAGDHLPQIFGASGYALLPNPAQLPPALVEWTRRLLAR